MQPRIQLAFWAARAHRQLSDSFSSTSTPQVRLCRAALNSFIPLAVLILGTASTQVQDLALDLVERHEVHMSHTGLFTWLPSLDSFLVRASASSKYK